MTAEDLKKLQHHAAALQEIATKIENQEEYATYLSSHGGTPSDQQELRVVTYGKIVRLVKAVLESDAAIVALDPALLNVDDDYS